MYKIEIEEKSYEIPSDWSEVSLKDMMDIESVVSDDDTTDLIKTIKLISKLSGISIDTLYDCDIDDIKLFDFNWVAEPIDKTLDKFVEIDGVKYGIVNNIKKLKLGEYADLDYYIKDILKNLHLIAAVLIRPVIKEDGDYYEIEKYNTDTSKIRADLFYNKMKVSQILGITDFFQNSVNGS